MMKWVLTLCALAGFDKDAVGSNANPKARSTGYRSNKQQKNKHGRKTE
jgi:hypothetical protein